MATKQLTVDQAFRLLDRYNTLMKSAQAESQLDKIITQLYDAGYIIRPAQVIIIKDEVNAEHINPNSNEWTLHSRATRMPVERPKNG